MSPFGGEMRRAIRRALRIAVVKVSKQRFEQLVAEALDMLPDAFRNHLDNVGVVVEDRPDPEVEREFGEDLTGLYQGVPLTERSVMDPPMPDVIFIYRRNIQEFCETEEEIREEVRLTVMHEIGHHFGMSEDQLEDV